MLLAGPGADYEKFVAPTAKLKPFMAPRGYRGPEGARRYWQDAEAGGWSIEIEIDAVQAREDRAVAEGRLQARREHVDETHALAWGVRIEDSMVEEFCAFADPQGAKRWLAEGRPAAEDGNGDTEAAVRSLFQRWENGESLEDCVDPEATFVSAMAPGRRYRGPTGAEQYRLDAEAAGWRIQPEIHDVHVRENRALVVGCLTIVNETITDRLELVWGCRCHRGRIIEGRAFHDRENAWAWLHDDASEPAADAAAATPPIAEH